MKLVLSDVIGFNGDVLVLTFREHLELRKMLDYLVMRDCFFVHRQNDVRGLRQLIVRAVDHPDLFTLGRIASFYLQEEKR